MKYSRGLVATLLCLLIGVSINAQPVQQQSDRLVDNNLKFKVITERVHTRGMMEVCISDTSENCIDNLLSGYVVRIFDADGNEIWMGWQNCGKGSNAEISQTHARGDLDNHYSI